jgi:predicted ATP-grasp superfamily ATP-dependent carboligase
MKLFIFEYASAGGPNSGSSDAPFLEEGMAMLSALLGDFQRLNGINVTTMLGPGIVGGAGRFPADGVLEPRGSFEGCVSVGMESADALLIIAPETDGILHRLTKKGEELGKPIVGSSSRAVEILGDKFKCWELLSGSVAMPETKEFTGEIPFPPSVLPSIIKPRCGAGSENVFISDARAIPDLPGNGKIVQPFVEGDPLSAGFVASESSVRLLGVCRQKLNIGRKVTFEGVTGPIAYHSPEELVDMANTVHEKVPGLKGYFGLDFIDGQSGIVLIEVNPRLTTSYPIYSANSDKNLAELLLESASVDAGGF